MPRIHLAAFAFAFVAVAAQAEAPRAAVPVTADNFTRAESDLYFAGIVKEAGGVGKLLHHREMAPVDNQTVVRLNRDTLYSAGVWDLDAGPISIVLPDAGKRFRSLFAISQDHFVPAVMYDGGRYELDRKAVGTRYVALAIRTLANPGDAADLAAAHALQDATRIEQAGGPGRFEIPAWDSGSQGKVRDALKALAETLPDMRHAFGTRGEVDPVRHLIGSASAWGGNPDEAALYLNVTPAKNDGDTVYRLIAKDVPVDGFWSVSLYDRQGYYEKNPYDAYSINNLTAEKGTDGSVTIQFGGCDGKVPNCLPIMDGWNYMVRLYRPRQALLDGSWKFPEAQPAAAL